jgi:hypothetical protein
VVVWGNGDIVDAPDLVVRDGAGDPLLNVATGGLAETSTFQRPAFDWNCAQAVAGGTLGHDVATLTQTATHTDDYVVNVYRFGDRIGMCGWNNIRDDQANGFVYNSPAGGAGSASVSSGPQAYASALMVVQTDGSGSWRAGVTPPGTVSVDVTLSDGTVVPAQLGADTYVVWLPGAGEFNKIVMTTATELWTV